MRTGGKNLVLTAMVFAVAMMFIDQTIVVLAIPSLQHEIKLSPTGAQWIVNGYLLSLSALFAFGGRVADLWGHRRTVIAASAAFEGASAAFLFPAALAIVVSTYDISERGKYLAIFFSISGLFSRYIPGDSLSGLFCPGPAVAFAPP